MGPSPSIVNFNAFRDFYFRGEGLNNLLIGATRCSDGTRIVWRFSKSKTSGNIDLKQESQLYHFYHEHFVAPFIDNSFLIKPNLVQIRASDLGHLAKIPSLSRNSKIEKFAELHDESKYPESTSRFPNINRNDSSIVHVLEMLDATALPFSVSSPLGSIITVELKPMHGFCRTNPRELTAPYCFRCIFWVEKWTRSNSPLHGVCPLSIYSGDPARTATALNSLLHRPLNKLCIFVDGNIVHDGTYTLNRDHLARTLFNGASAIGIDIGTFVDTICYILTGTSVDQTKSSVVRQGLKHGSVLANLLDAQQIDTVGICQAYQNYKKLDPNVQRQLGQPSHWMNRRALYFLGKNDPQSLVERYLLGVTFSHCSVMLNLQLAKQSAETNNNEDDALGPVAANGRVRRRAADGRPLEFVYSVRIVDLDPKAANRLEDKYRRYIRGLELLRTNPDLRQPCY